MTPNLSSLTTTDKIRLAAEFDKQKPRPMTTPTTEIDSVDDSVDANLISLENFPHLHKKVVYADFARKLERERDEAIDYAKRQDRVLQIYLNELTQLRKVCDELAEYGDRLNVANADFLHLLAGHSLDCDCPRCESCVAYQKALTNYSTLPHVIKAKGLK
jgi:hypothetical protein